MRAENCFREIDLKETILGPFWEHLPERQQVTNGVKYVLAACGRKMRQLAPA